MSRTKYLVKKAPKAMKRSIFAVVFLLASLSVLILILPGSPLKSFIVLSGSMSPTITEGSVIFVWRDYGNLKTGDIITYIHPQDANKNVTHRIISVNRDNKEVVFKTKGDQNNQADTWSLEKGKIWGKFLFSIPYLGSIVTFAQTKLGVILVVTMPLLAVSFYELKTMHHEVKKIRKRIPDEM